MLRVVRRVAGWLCIAGIVPALAFGQPARPGQTAPVPTPSTMASQRAAATQLRAVRATRVADGLQVAVIGNGLLSGVNLNELQLPPRVMIDFHRVDPGAVPRVTNVGLDVIRRVRVATNSSDPLITRVVIDLTRRVPFMVEQLGNEVRVIFRPSAEVVAPSPPPAPPSAPESPPIAMPASAQAAPPMETPPFAPEARPPAVHPVAPIAPSHPPLPAISAALFRMFLTDGRVLSSYGEWSRLGDRVVFSMPAQLTRDPIELHLVTIPSQRVDWPRTEAYAESVRAAAYVTNRGDADFAAFSTELAKTLNDVAQIKDPAARLATAERAREKLADWPRSHYGYRVGEVRDALAVLDEVIAQLRVSMGITRFDLSLSASAPLSGPPPPPLPPPTDAELVEQFAAAASIADSPDERIGLLQTVMRLIDRAIGLMPAEWASRMRGTAGTELARERRIEQTYDDLRTRSLAEAARLATRGRMSDLERLRDRVRDEDRRLGGHRAGDVAALLATIDLQAAAMIARRETRTTWERRAPIFRSYRRATNGAFKTFGAALPALEQIKTMSGPPVVTIAPLTERLSAASRGFRKVVAPDELAPAHALIASAWELADHALRLRLEAVSANSVDVAQRASSAAAGALMLYQRARADQLSVMEPPSTK